MLAVVACNIVIFIQVVFTINVINELLQSVTPFEFPLALNSAPKYISRAISSAELVANEFNVLRPLNGDAKFVFLDGPPPLVRFENNERVMEQVLLDLPSVKRMSVIAHLYNLLCVINQFAKFLTQFCIRYEIVLSRGRIGFGIEIQFPDVFVSATRRCWTNTRAHPLSKNINALIWLASNWLTHFNELFLKSAGITWAVTVTFNDVWMKHDM